MNRRPCRVRPARLRVALLLAASAGTAHADADEASLGVHVIGGAARLGEDGAGSASTVPLVGIGGRLTYAFHNAYAWEAAVAFATGTNASYANFPDPAGGPAGALARTTRLARLELGATARFGVRYIPTLHAGLGTALRFRGGGDFTTFGQTEEDALASEVVLDLVGVGGLGFDVRINRRWIAGTSIELRHAIPIGGPSFDSVEGFLHLSYYWYPRIFAFSD